MSPVVDGSDGVRLPTPFRIILELARAGLPPSFWMLDRDQIERAAD
jgi:hypothetical protein